MRDNVKLPVSVGKMFAALAAAMAAVLALVAALTLAAAIAAFVPASAYASNGQASEKDVELAATYATAADLTAPVITSIDMSQAYKIDNFNGAVITSSGKTFAKGNKPYAAWADSNVVEVKFKNDSAAKGFNSFNVDYFLQRSTNQTSGWQDIASKNSATNTLKYQSQRTTSHVPYQAYTELGNSNFKFTDCAAKRGNTYFYRVVAKYSYYDQSQGRTVTGEKASAAVSTRTSPKTFTASSFKVNAGKSWKSSASVRGKISIYRKGLSHKYKISWKKRNDVSGYYVYRVNIKAVQLKNIKSWQYAETGLSQTLSIGKRVPIGNYVTPTTAKKWCKKVKTLGANATSYTFSLKDKVNFSSMHHYAYVIVPYLKQNGKVYTADAKKAFYTYSSGYGGGVGNVAKYKVQTKTIDFTKYVPFAL